MNFRNPRRQDVVLAIDDERSILHIVKTTLEGEGYKVHTASGPKEGIELYETHWREIKLVLLDFMMPDMTGDLDFGLLQRFNPDVRVVLLTAYHENVTGEMFANGLWGFMRKPFYSQDLKNRVHDAINSQ